MAASACDAPLMRVLPDGFALALDRSLRRFKDGTVLAGGHPGRVITLTVQGAGALDAVVGGEPASGAMAELAGRLVEAGMAHPRRRVSNTSPPAGRSAASVTIVVPAHDRPGALEECLRSIDQGVPVIVVDDASVDPGPVAAVCATHGARLIRRTENGGPAAARNDALAMVDTDLVAFVDSDCTVSAGWLDGLIWLFDDPSIGAVAPRIRPKASSDWSGTRAIDRFSWFHSPLDLGPDEGEVGPRRAVRYVPTAALVVRRDALADVAGFDADLRVGEDVDLVWRLVEAGWRVRYVPSVTVSHAEPGRWGGLLARRLSYGTSAAPLSTRHPGALAPMELRPLPALAAVAVLSGRPRVALAAQACSALALSRTVRPLGIPAAQSLTWSAQGTAWTIIGMGRSATMLAWPALALLAVRGGRARRAAMALALLPPIVEWVRIRPDLDLPRWVAASIADDLAYGTGVWKGCLRTRSWGPLMPIAAPRTPESRSGGIIKSDEYSSRADRPL